LVQKFARAGDHADPGGQGDGQRRWRYRYGMDSGDSRG